MSRFLHKGSNKERVKVHFELTIKTAENVPSTGNVYVQWKRGKKSENKGETKHVPVGKDKKAVFEELVEISATLYKIPKKGYESKNISLALKEEKGKKGTSVAKTVIDLAEFAGNRDENRSFSLKSKKSKVAPTLTLHFKSKERELAPDEDVTETDNVTEENLSDEEEDVEDFTDDTKDDVSSNKSGKSSSSKTSSTAPTPTLTATPSSKDEGKRDSRRDSVSSISSTSSSSNINLNTNDIEELRAELEKAKKREADLKKRSRELATENVDFEEKIKDLTKEIDNLKKSKSSPGPMSPDKESDLRNKIKDLSMENNDLEETITKLKKEVEDAKQAATAAAAASAASSAPSPAMTSDKEAQMKKRLRELATENVDLEEQVNALKKELEDAKSQGGKKSDDGPQKQVQELNDRIKEKDGIILSQKQELENRIKEKDGTILSQKQEIDNLKKGSDNKLAEKEELRKKIKDLIKANEETEEEVETLKKQVEQLKKTSSSQPPPSLSVSASISSDDAKRLQNEIHEKDDKIRDLEREIEKLKSQLDDKSKRDLNKSSGSSDSSELKNTIASQKAEIEKLKKDLERATLKKGSSTDLGQVEELSRSNKDLQDTVDNLRKYEKDIEKEREARKKAEKDARETREQLRDLEDKLEELERGSQGTTNSNSTHALPNGKDDAKLTVLEKELEHEKEIVAAVFAGAGTYADKEGVSQSALQVWSVLHNARAYLAPSDDDEGKQSRAVADRVVELLKTACTCTPNEMNMLFYWLSTTCALLHMLRDEPDVHSNNDRDPIIDGVYQPAKEPSSRNTDLQDRLEWLAFTVYKQLVTVICNKLTPVLAPVIIERPLTDKKTQVKTSSVMRILDRVLARTRHHYLYDAVTQQLFVQIFYFINCHLVNTILKKDKLTPSIGFQIKLGISHLEDWIAQPSGSAAERTLLAPCSAQLDGMRDVGGVLVLDKGLFSDATTLQTIFRTLGLRQIKRLLEVFEPDQLAPQGAAGSPMPMNVRDAVASTWGNREAASQPLLLDQGKIIDFSPQLD